MPTRTARQPTSAASSLDLLNEAATATEAMKEDWLGIVKAHHQMLERAFDELIETEGDLAQRPAQEDVADLLSAVDDRLDGRFMRAEHEPGVRAEEMHRREARDVVDLL